MKKYLVSFIPYIVSIVLSIPCCVFSILMFNGSISILFGVLAELGWIITLFSFLFILQYLMDIKKQLNSRISEMIEQYNTQIITLKKQENKFVRYYNYIFGYNESFADKVNFYSKMLDKGIKIPVVNNLVNFAYEVKPNDTVFLIRVDNDANTWHFKVCGSSIHLAQAKIAMEMAVEQCDRMAASDSLIWKQDVIIN